MDAELVVVVVAIVLETFDGYLPDRTLQSLDLPIGSWAIEASRF